MNGKDISKSLLVIDDEPSHRLMVRAVMEDAGWHVEEASSGEEGLRVFEKNSNVAVALVDMKMPGINGQETLRRLHIINSSLPVILLTAYGTVGSAVQAMKEGAFDYLTKPADNDELILTLNRAWEYSRLLQENNRLRNQVSNNEAMDNLAGKSKSMRQVHDFINQAGPSEATILITGESGTGKERIAEALHAVSERSTKPLVKVNCAALPAQLLESELFGYEKGAFTGAVKDKPGRFQLAQGGTLFLDEIGELPLDLQAKLLRALQEREIEPLGSIRPIVVDVRILAASNRNLLQAVKEENFRQDLYFRLNVLEIEAPPLREHLEDLPILVSHLLSKLSEKNRKEIRSVSPAFLQALATYHWPGNVRELENVLERALILSRSDALEPESLPLIIYNHSDENQEQNTATQLTLSMGSALSQGKESSEKKMFVEAEGLPRDSSDPKKTATQTMVNGGKKLNSPIEKPQAILLEDAEKAAIIKALELNDGHRENTAESLGISRRTLQYKLKRYGLTKR